MRKQFLSAWIAAANPPLPSLSDDHRFDIDYETTELPPCPPSIEFLVTDECAKVRLSKAILSKVLDAHVRHHLTGRE
jgi:hypothetical protein